MSNKFLTVKQVCAEFNKALLKAAGGDLKKYRALVYDLQTSMGGFPASKAERKRYIEGKA